MNKNLVICSDIYYDIDLTFYEKNKIEHLKFNSLADYEYLTTFDLENYNDVIVILDDVMFDNIYKTSNPFNSELHQTNNTNTNDVDIFFNNFQIFFDKFSDNTKFVVYDNNIEIPQKSIIKFILNWLDMRSKNYFISSRFDSIIHERSITGLVYLPLIFSFYMLNFNRYDKLEYSTPTNPKYNFITYLGNCGNVDKINHRFNFLKAMLRNRIDKLKHENNSNSKLGLKYLIQHKGEGHYWNLLNSLSAKIQLIFETIHPTVKYHDEYYFSEKTMKLFILPHPYFLLVHGTVLEKLEKFGFMFSEKCFSYYDFTKSFDKMLSDIDKWIEINNKVFEHNQENFYYMINSNNLKHHLFLEKIITS